MKKPNRLINEKSLYLKMHAYNPVDWYPWGDEAFDRAKKENKPVFLSIGYSSCHWCHVMEKESFENEEVSDFLNKYFISIKVDKEERPDIDSVYMEYCILLNNSGGWPLSVFLTPEKDPFFAGTYFPKQNFLRLLKQIKELWDKDHQNIIRKSRQVIEQLKSHMSQSDKKTLPEDIIKRALYTLYNNYDDEYGGFGNAPKFPSLQNILFLLKSQKQEFQNIALDTLTRMRLGGIFDHVEGGFHRYSTDRYWLLPHFEKMLYDQAMSILAYSEAYRLSKEEIYKDSVYKTFDFVMEYLYKDGYFYTAMDADTEGEEGGYYVFSIDEIQNILKERAPKFIEFFNIKKEGNFLDEATKRKTGKNIFYAKGFSKEFDEDLKLLKAYKQNRQKPLIDDKVLLDQNALMDYALIEAYLVFDDDKFLNVAKTNIENILNGNFYHVLNNPKAIEPILDDYAFFIKALLSIYKTTFDKKYLEKAIEYMEKAIDKLWDKTSGGFYISLNKDVILPQKPLYDGAIPSGNSFMGLNLVELFFITKEDKYEHYYNILSSLYSFMLMQNPSSASFFLSSFMLLKYGYQLCFSMSMPKAQYYIKEFYKHYIPNVVIYQEDNKDEAFIMCKDYVCFNPIYSMNELIENLNKKQVLD